MAFEATFPDADVSSSRVPLFMAWTVLLILVVARVIASFHLNNPIINSDEAGYLGNAHFLVTDYGNTFQGYSAGYSVLLIPAALLAKAPRVFYHAALVSNSVSMAVTAIASYLLAKEFFPNGKRWVNFVVALTAILLPITFLYNFLAMSENVIIPAVLLCCYFYARALRERSSRWIVAASTSAVFAYFANPRGMALIGALSVALAVALVMSELKFRIVALGLITLAVESPFLRLLNQLIKHTTVSQGLNPDKSFMRTLTHPHLWREFLAEMVGHLAYAGVSGFGLLIVGLVVCVWMFFKTATNDKRTHYLLAFLIVVGTLLFEVLGQSSLGLDSRLDFIYYGRYVFDIGVPVVVIGFAWLLNSELSRKSVGLIALGVFAATVLSTLAVHLIQPNRPAESTTNFANVSSLIPLQRLLTHNQTITKLLLLGAVITLLILISGMISRRLTALVVLSVLAAGNVVVFHDYLLAGSRSRVQQGVVAATIKQLDKEGIDTSCVQIDSKHPPSAWHLADYAFLLPKTTFDSERSPTCGPLLISSASPDYESLGQYALITTENFINNNLYLDTSRVFPNVIAELNQRGYLFRSNPCRVESDSYYQSSLAVNAKPMKTLADLENTQISIAATHPRGADPWLGANAAITNQQCGTVRTVISVVNDEGKVLLSHSVGLSSTAVGHDTVKVNAHIIDAKQKIAANDVFRLRNSIKVVVSLEQLGVTNFTEHGDHQVTVATLSDLAK